LLERGHLVGDGLFFIVRQAFTSCSLRLC